MTPNRPHPSAAYILAALSRHSARCGRPALARARLIECLSLLHSSGSERSGALALEAAAELAAATGELERAVEFYGARERILRRVSRSGPASLEVRTQALESLRERLDREQFEAAWNASRGTPFPFEFYVSAALHWLEGLDPSQFRSTLPPDDETPTSKTSADEGTTAQLIAETRGGNTEARERLVERHLAPLRRFGHGRLQNRARKMVDTDDLVQTTMIRGLDRLDVIEPRKKGSFLAYLKKILLNQARDEARRTSRVPEASQLNEALTSQAPTPLDDLLEQETFLAYERALAALPPRQREAVALRVDGGCSYQEVADAIGCPSANAARMLVSRGLVRVAKALRRGQ